VAVDGRDVVKPGRMHVVLAQVGHNLLALFALPLLSCV
jgi:hypothetical protein